MRKALTIAAAALAALLVAVPASAQESGGDRLPPSAAVKLAVGAMPGAEPLGVKLRGDTYIVRLKQGGRIVQVEVDAVTGAVILLQ